MTSTGPPPLPTSVPPPLPPSARAPTDNPQSSLAVASLVLSLLGVLCFWGITAIPAIICGHMALGRIRRSGGTLEGYPMALTGLILGYIESALSLIAVAVIALSISHQTRMARERRRHGGVGQPVPYARVRGEILGRHLAEHHGNRSVLLMLQDRPSRRAEDEAFREGLEKGLGHMPDAVCLEAPGGPENGADTATGGAHERPPAEYYFAREMVEMALGSHDGDFDLVVCAVGLPHDMDFAAFREGGVVFAVAGGSVQDLRDAIRCGDVVAAIATKPGAWHRGGRVHGNPKHAFNRRYVLLTPGNVDAMAQQFPGMLH